MIKDKLEGVLARIALAARAGGRDPETVRLICVTKGVSVDQIQEAMACGVHEIGENRVQEAQTKQSALGLGRVRWHMIGHLQRNKAKFAVELFDVIHSIDSVELVEVLDRQASERRANPLEGLIQVNVSQQRTKHGCSPQQVEALAERILQSKHLKWIGLMTMAPLSDNPETSRPFFRRLRELRDQLQERFLQSSMHLSMGMSQDFEVAVQEGATMIRIGTAIFGS